MPQQLRDNSALADHAITRVNATLPVWLVEAFNRMALETTRSRSFYIREAMTRYLQENGHGQQRP